MGVVPDQNGPCEAGSSSCFPPRAKSAKLASILSVRMDTNYFPDWKGSQSNPQTSLFSGSL